MKAVTTRKTNKVQQNEEVIYLSLLLSCVNERISALTPGVNCTFQEFRKLTDEKIELTLRVNKAILDLRGCTFVEENDSTYTCNNVVLKLGGTYRQRVRA